MKAFVFTLITAVLLSSSSCVRVQFGPPPAEAGIHHIVLVWLKLSGNPSYRHQIIAQSQRLEKIPGVLSVNAGRSLFSNRAVVDHSFDVGLDITFETSEDLQRYLTHPDHLRFVEEIKPLVKRIQVYDIRK
ncbi:MAG: Dabb family protein [Verrucomicrobiales bacterium]|nr:Dabb family protein [Verrucomicrobiales bacterium]